VVGDGPAVPDLRQQAEQLGLQQRVRWFGAVAPADLPAVVCAFDAAVIPAINAYASPLKLFDYLAAGVPSLVPDQANLRELVRDRKHAMLFRPGDGAALVGKLRELCAAPDLAATIGAAGRRRLLDREWTWAGSAKRVITAYEQAAAVFDRILPANDLLHALPAKGRGQSLLGLGRPEEAVAELERALELHRLHDNEPLERADVSFALARALVALGRDPARGRSLAEAARERFAALGQDNRVIEIDNWMEMNERIMSDE
ncbi:MAG: glycosyltransferase, partial [Myxococcales bacterium]|nr:glycosyltransferase [Myxococcales bacterium]